jgi:hypothetical protein
LISLKDLQNASAKKAANARKTGVIAMEDDVQKRKDWQQEYKCAFGDFDGFDDDDDVFSSISPSGHTQHYSTQETFDEMIRRKTDENMKRLFGPSRRRQGKDDNKPYG